MAQSQLELPDTTQAAVVVAAVAAVEEAAVVVDEQPRGTKRTNHHAVSVAKLFLATSVSLRAI